MILYVNVYIHTTGTVGTKYLYASHNHYVDVNGGPIAGRGKRLISLLRTVQTGSRHHPASYSKGARVRFPWVKGRPLIPSTSEVKERSYNAPILIHG
jgi:hypothetical protein